MSAYTSDHLYNSNLSYYSNKLCPLQIHIDFKDKINNFKDDLSDVRSALESMNLSTKSTFRQKSRTPQIRTCPSPPRATNNTPFCWSHIHFTQ